MDHEPFSAEASAIILTGGKSSRMGRPKALLPFDGEPLIVHLVRMLKSQFADAVVVAAPDQELPPLPATVARDEVAYQGPVGGLYYGLKAASHSIAFVTSCDAAFLNLPLIGYLMSRIADNDVVVPYWQERLQPLHALYRRSVLPLIEEQLQRGELRPVFLYPKVRTCRVGEEEIRRFDPDGQSFFNMNSPEDYAQALKLWDTRRRARKDRPDPIISCVVELFGVARLLAKTRTISISLPHGATLRHVLAALSDRLPVLVGRVIDSDRTTLVAGFACNINGLDFVHDPALIIQPNDRVFILSADAGG